MIHPSHKRLRNLEINERNGRWVGGMCVCVYTDGKDIDEKREAITVFMLVTSDLKIRRTNAPETNQNFINRFSKLNTKYQKEDEN